MSAERRSAVGSLEGRRMTFVSHSKIVWWISSIQNVTDAMIVYTLQLRLRLEVEAITKCHYVSE